ncbi:MAG: disulfide bond formation protein B [Halieaceae bacterium]|nr:disulfide bond formation protein B [Halieaceae bacterium]
MIFLSNILLTRWYWMALAIAGSALLAVALYYQYVLGDEPCQVCIHARLWVVAFTLIALVMLVTSQRRILRVVANIGVVIACAGLTERARYLYRLENGIGDGSCQFQLGMPYWFAVDQWMPWLFEVRNLCSFTPTMLFGLSMAESLMGIGAILCLVAATKIGMDLFKPCRSALN